MSDTVSYDENIEVQETNFSSGGGDGGGDNSSVSSRGSSSHHHHHHTSSYSHHTTYGHSGGGGHHYGGGGRHYGGSKMLPGDGKACKPVIIVVCLVIIAAGLYTFVSSSIEDLTRWANTPAAATPPLPPKPWSGDFSGRYIRQNDGAWAKDSASTRNTAVAKVLADLDGRQFFISKSEVGREEEEKDESGRVSSNFTTTYFTVVRELDRGAKLPFNFTSGVRFTQKTTRKGKNVVKFNDNEPDYHWEEVPTTITVETWADGGKKGIWREVQHSSPEVKIKRIFFDDEMTAIFQSKVEHYANRWDIYVMRYHRRPLY